MMCYDSGMQKNNEKGSALTLVIAGTFSFFAVLAVVLWYFFSYAPEQRRLEGVQAIEAVREQEQAGKEDIGTPLAGTVKICTKQEGEIIVRYYLNGPRVRVAELTTTLSRVRNKYDSNDTTDVSSRACRHEHASRALCRHISWILRSDARASNRTQQSMRSAI